MAANHLGRLASNEFFGSQLGVPHGQQRLLGFEVGVVEADHLAQPIVARRSGVSKSRRLHAEPSAGV